MLRDYHDYRDYRDYLLCCCVPLVAVFHSNKTSVQINSKLLQNETMLGNARTLDLRLPALIVLEPETNLPLHD